MFKIVQILEKGNPQHYIIPGTWEKKEVLYWPKSKADKLVQVSKSTPESWFQMPCTLKITDLATVETAERELHKMLRYEDTGNSEITLISKMKQARMLLPKRSNIETGFCTNFNPIVESCMEEESSIISTCSPLNTQVAPPVSEQTTPISLNQSHSQPKMASIIITDDESQQDLEMQKIQHSVSSHVPQLSNNLPHKSNIANSPRSNESFLQHNSPLTKDPLGVPGVFHFPVIESKENYQKILKNQETIIQNQSVILNELAGFGVMFENITKRLDKIGGNSHGQEQPAPNHAEVDLKDFKPIDSLQDLTSFDEKLKNESYMQLLIEKLSFICGKTGEENGVNVSYTLVDKLFTRTFMTECSWAGGSRGEKEKVPFKIYKNVIKLFFNLVCLADNKFTLENCENFFKNVLKNSVRRCEIKKTARSSKCKRRPSKLTYKAKGLGEKNIEYVKIEYLE